ncbi:hypothetical protein, partial [Pseudomonas sp. FEN]
GTVSNAAAHAGAGTSRGIRPRQSGFGESGGDDGQDWTLVLL